MSERAVGEQARNGQARNDAAFCARVDELAAGRARHAVLSIDADDVSQVNHESGDEAGAERSTVAAAMQAAMQAALRMNDCLFQTGDGEFAVVVPVRDEGDALRIAERIRRAAERAGWPVSVGIAVSEPGSTERGELFARADTALRGLRRRGCNGTALAHPEQHQLLIRS